ncbi:MAG: hypothetical protein IKS10_04465 [Lachnospiraceae bacterium]|nr:hypothetical protein [Lachnospiraceae bacterium]
MKEKLCVAFLGLLLGAVIVITGINAYTLLGNSSRKQELTLVGATGAFDYSHKLEGFIPLGTDHYWLGLDQTTGKIYYIRASQKWFDKNFPNGEPKDADGVKITGVQCKVTDHELRDAMDQHMKDLGVPVLNRGSKNGEFLMLNSASVGIFSLFVAIGGLLSVIFGILIYVKRDSFPIKVKTIFGCFILVWAMAVAFYLVRFGLLI